MIMDKDIFLLIALLGLVTFATRAGGHVMMLMFKTIHPRVEAALDAVPAAVLTTIVVPVAMTSGWKEALTILASALVGLRFGIIGVLVFGTIMIATLRLIFGSG